MQFVPSTPLALVGLVLLAGLGVRRGAWVFFALLPFGAAAAFNLPALGGATIGVADLAAVMLFVLVLLSPASGSSIFGTLRAWQPGFFLTGVLVVSAFSAIFYPRFFAGATDVFAIARNPDGPGIVRYPLGPSTGNITQLFRMMLGFMVFVAFATAFRRVSEIRPVIVAMVVATSVNFVLGWLDVLTYSTGTGYLLDWIRTANYSLHITDTMAGIKRMIGGFPEASSFGYFSLGLFGFWLQYWISAPRSKSAPWMLAMATIMVLRSTSSSAYLALVVFVAAFAIYTFFRNLRPEAERRSVSLTVSGFLSMWLAVVAAAASYAFVQPATDFLDRVLFKKLETSSGVERMSWNAQALINFADTWGFGAGIGSVRASNWVIACLGSIGVIGSALFIGFLTAVALAPTGRASDPRSGVARALKAGCLAMLSVAFLTFSTPDLGLFFFAVAGAATGLSRAMVLESAAPLAS